ncbi:hypothetical protein FSP39_018188 [Pinctada imbricata]|uniref:Transposon Tf2-9 poly n=1 Tax=Pinctada imbricata TaxID=66713 RepID=A0AA89BMQ5_PINIB|nr:hypothetical protein FSP39_018188 [Pinctada imbricata]
MELEEESKHITTFSTHLGLYRYKRLNFGISSASEIFQETIRSVIRDVQGAKNLSDDIIIYGKTQKDHDRSLEAVFQALQESGLTLNKEKCEFNKSEIEFFGVVFSKDGISPDPKKVRAIKEAAPPTNSSELRSFLGMTNYSARFIPDYATICEPLRRLTRQDNEWEWGVEQDQAFEKLKSELSSDTIIKYYNPESEISILVDASPVGLGAIMAQDEKVVAYASHALTDVESRYSQTEREALAIVWACEHFDMYIRGAPCVNIVTDHKPLETIWQKPKPPLRIERWGLRLQPYKLKIRYEPGHSNPADYMSRHPCATKKHSHEEKIAESYVNFITTGSVPKAMTLDEVKSASNEDKTIQKAIEFAGNGRWHEIKSITDTDIDIAELQAYRNIRNELVVHSENILLRDHRIVMPYKLRKTAIHIAHEGHQGLTKTKAFIRSKIWFPGINDEVDSVIKDCAACQINTPARYMEPLHMSELPAHPWDNLSMDFCGPLPSGDYLFVIIDEYSRYPVVEIIRSLSAHTVIPTLDKVLSVFGIPSMIKSDNGAPFNSHAFKEFAQNMGFKHRKIMPLWPRANAQAEAFNKPLMKAVKSAHIEGRSWKQEMFRFLRQYRATPHTSTAFTPHRLLFGREPSTKLPKVQRKNTQNSEITEKVRQNDEQSKAKMKNAADKRNHASKSELNQGDHVLIRNERKGNKLTPTYNPESLTVTRKKGSMITATDGNKEITRIASVMKKTTVTPETCVTPQEEEEDEEEIAIDTGPSTSPNTPVNRPKRISKPPSYLQDYVRF